MFEKSFYNPEIITLAWAVIFVSDWIMNYSGAKMYYSRVASHIKYEKGDNLRPISIEEIHHPLMLLARFLSELVISSLAIWFLLYTCKLYSSKDFYEAICGFFILLEACIHFRHLGNVALYTSFGKNSGITGSISFPNYVTLKTAAVDYFIFAAAFLFIFFLNRMNFCLGGAISCFFASFFNYAHALVSKYEYQYSLKFLKEGIA